MHQSNKSKYINSPICGYCKKYVLNVLYQKNIKKQGYKEEISMINVKINQYTKINAFITDCLSKDNLKTLSNELSCYEPYLPDLYESDYSFSLIKTYPKTHPLNGLCLYCDSSDSMLLILKDDRILGFSSYFSYYRKTSEISVLVDPDFRRHKIGSTLVFEIINKINQLNNIETDCEKESSDYDDNSRDKEFDHPSCILLTGSNESFANYCGFSYSHSEHFMQYDISKKSIKSTKENNIRFDCHKNKNGHMTISMYLNDKRVSRLRLDFFDSYINISKVYTNKAYRKKGYAGMLLKYVITNIADKNLLLQVSGSNTTAIHAYLRAGFTFIHTIDYYGNDD